MGHEDTIYSIVQYGIYREKETMRLAQWLLCVDSDIICGKMKPCNEFKHLLLHCITNIFTLAALQ